MDISKFFSRKYWKDLNENHVEEPIEDVVYKSPILANVRVVVTPAGRIFFYVGDASYWDFLNSREKENGFLFYVEGDNRHNPNINFCGFDQTLFPGAYELCIEIRANDKDAINSHSAYVVSATNIII